ncbi:MAG: hypothetical protein AAF702_20050 [Chloroflexota bacterium]
MFASNVFQKSRRWVTVLLVAVALVASTVGFMSVDLTIAWNDVPALADGGQSGIGGG